MAVSVLFLHLLILRFFIRFCVCLSGYDHTQIILFLQNFFSELAPVARRRTVRQREGTVIAALFSVQNELSSRCITVEVLRHPKSLGNDAKAKAIFMISIDSAGLFPKECG